MNTFVSGFCLLVMIAVMPALAADHLGGSAGADGRKALIEMNEKMVRTHRKAADCLKAGKPVDQCNMEAMKICPLTNSSICPFMGNMGKMHEKMMKGGDEMKGMSGMDENAQPQKK
jgi:hypothetical protein